MKVITQPDMLKTDDYLPSCGGKGNDVWRMMTASMTGETQIAQELLKQNPTLVNCSWAYFTPLHFAVREGHEDMVEVLLGYGADATAISGISWQDSPLQKAKDRGYDSLVEILERHLEQKLQSNSFGERMAVLMKERNESALIGWLEETPYAIHSSDGRGNTAMHWAVLTRQLRIIDFLIEKGADLDATRADGSKPVHLALEGDYFYRSEESTKNKWFLVGYLISKGATYDIFIASAVGDEEYVRELLSNDSIKVNALDSSGRSSLYYAAKNGNESIVQALLKKGADPNQPEKDAPGGAALHAAVSEKHQSIVKMLLDHGADPNAEVEASGNALYFATRNGHQELVDLLYAAGGSLSLSAACTLGRMDLVGEILAVSPSEVNAGDFGPLTQAISEGHADIVRLLLKVGVELNDSWYTSNYMTYAIRFSDEEIVKMLLDKGADPNLSNWLGVSYLHIAAMLGKVGMAKMLLEYGADLEKTDDEYGTTPLGWAAKYGQEDMVLFLLKNGAKPSSKRVQDWAKPIAWAERKGYAAILEKLR
ncbi:ankyrin repeat domain-containing protein [Bacillus haimaensis]|uniref:ankyrin repeat domain-containing protein n=1 Tax=Bacillus haimaensis TaxID=3160967 RepID=UPI003AA8C1F1